MSSRNNDPLSTFRPEARQGIPSHPDPTPLPGRATSPRRSALVIQLHIGASRSLIMRQQATPFAFPNLFRCRFPRYSPQLPLLGKVPTNRLFQDKIQAAIAILPHVQIRRI